MTARTAARRRLLTPRRALLAAVVLGVLTSLVVMVTPSPGDNTLAGQQSWTVDSPRKAVSATVAARDGELSLTVSRGGRTVVQTPLGRVDERAQVSAREDALKERYSTPAGKRREHTLDARRFTLNAPGDRRLEVVVADDGVAFRQTAAGTEVTAFRAPEGTRRWLQHYGRQYEGMYRPGALAAAPAGDYGVPALLRTPDGTYALLTESGLTREAAAHLRIEDGHAGILKVVLPDGEATPRTTPWRVAVVGDLATIVGSDLPLSMGRPSQIADTSWIKPGRAAWSWWSDTKSPADAGRQRAFIRMAKAHGWEWVVMDAWWWNAGPTDALVQYASKRNVKVAVWTAWQALSDPAERERRFKEWHDLGIGGVKVDFLLSDSAERMAVMDDIARVAAKYHMIVNFHGSTVPRGIQRTWPNVLTMEGVRGAEYELDEIKGEATDPAHAINLAFTRNPIGSMDATPVSFSAQRRITTAGFRLATAVVYESGQQHYADSPESYARFPQAGDVLRGVPAAWDDTRLVSGDPDNHVVLARRSGETWWVGLLHRGEPAERQIDLSFLQPGRRYAAQIVRDDGWGTLTTESRTVTSTDWLPVQVDRNGGVTLQLSPQS